MTETIKFKKKKKAQERVLSAGYSMTFYNKKGKKKKFEMTGEEIITTICPKCQREHNLNLEKFFEVVQSGDFCLYGTMVYCEKCTKSRTIKR